MTRTTSGATLIEFALILAVVALVAVGVFRQVGGSVRNIFARVGAGLTTA